MPLGREVRIFYCPNRKQGKGPHNFSPVAYTTFFHLQTETITICKNDVERKCGTFRQAMEKNIKFSVYTYTHIAYNKFSHLHILQAYLHCITSKYIACFEHQYCNYITK